MALNVIERNIVDFMTEKRRPRGSAVDGEVNAGTRPFRPNGPFERDAFPNVDRSVRSWCKHISKRDKDAGSEDGNQENDPADRSEPPRMQPREQQDQQHVARDGKPVDDGVNEIGTRAPSRASDRQLNDSRNARKPDKKNP